MEGKDVMQSDNNAKRYQIFQGRIDLKLFLSDSYKVLTGYHVGNYSRFVNHSCAPNSQLQKFCWLGSERNTLTSRGVESGSEITVDYSDEYWKGLDKECMCSEPCCRYLKKQSKKA
jgi:SET domain-containing protein